MYRPRIAGITKVRNESLIIKETLDHFSVYCDAGIYVYDDVSTDDTVKICKRHPNVKGVVSTGVWDIDRERADYQTRQAVFDFAKSKDPNIDWFIYFDADERMYFDLDVRILESSDAVAMMLFDFYITEEDKDREYNGNLPILRQKVGPEFRRIIMMFRNQQGVGWDKPDQREPNLRFGSQVTVTGFVKHYGKSISIQHWEDTCNYYANNFPKYAEKWANRRGKAIHMFSDFGHELVTWNELATRAIPMK